MAEIAPFRGILYTPKSGDPSRLLAPPYDVISDAERVQLEQLDPHNCVRLILPQPDEKDPDSRYPRAARDLQQWLGEGVLARDEQPAIYRYHQSFAVDGAPIVRKGFVARIRLHRFDESVVLPHERTLSGPKADRLKLMRATRAHFSQIFGLYKDPDRRTDAPFVEIERSEPALEGTTTDGVHHRMWRLVDPAAQREVIDFLAEEKVYIADGHHRYETMLALREELRKEVPPGPGEGAPSGRSAVEYGVMFFCNMDDPGLVVLPTHRVLHGLAGFDRASLIKRAREFFVVVEGPLADPQVVKRALVGHAKKGPTFAMACPGAGTIAYLRVRGDLIVSSVPAMKGPKVFGELDVALLHGLLFETLLGIDRHAQEKQSNLRYAKALDKAFDELNSPDVQAVFLMNPTRVQQVQAMADAGEVMPQKSTFFYPKIASGLVMNPIDPAEEVPLPAAG
ncbi:MAG: DUF1015 domain-containing protein [Myxococcales bacterium]|nr:DUF1015 domain-containing protein [Myxococcales bacterium]